MTTALERLSAAYYNPGLKTLANPGGLSGTGALRANWNPFLTDLAEVASDVVDGAADVLDLALTALNSPATSATSITPMTPTVAAKTFTLQQVGKSFAKYQFVMVGAAADNWFAGNITAYDPATGIMTVNAMKLGATPAASSAWTISTTGLIDAAQDAKIAALEAADALQARRRRHLTGDLY